MGKKLDIHIEAEFGSEFQKETHTESLMTMLKAWNSFMKSVHKKNKVWVNGKEM